jgi:hypothetical protein
MNKRKVLSTVVLSLVVAFSLFVFFRFYFVFGKGTQAGVLNSFQQRGYVFKTWEGTIIQSGFKSGIQSNEFVFSVANEKVAQQLLTLSGREVNLHYSSYFGTLPWRGFSKNIVDSILEVRLPANDGGIQPK